MNMPNNFKLLKKSEANKYFKRNSLYYEKEKIIDSFEKNKIEPGGSTDNILNCFKKEEFWKISGLNNHD